jgi:hypothetical protein
MQFERIPDEQIKLPHENNFHQITPLFKHMTLLDEQASERARNPVYKTIEVVEVRFAGDRHYSPVFPVSKVYKRIGLRSVTYAERWADQYRQFVAGEDQVAAGTPLENLKPYGITPSQMSLCRALKIYSVEALHGLDGSNLKHLGMNANSLKDMARRYVADRQNASTANDEVEKLKAELAALRAQVIPPVEPTQDEIDAAQTAAAGDSFLTMSDEDLKAYIAEKSGARPRGNPSHETLVRLAQEVSVV